MNDDVYLLICALLFTAVGWAFWHFAGENAFDIISMVALIALAADNIRLRRLLRSSPPQPRADSVR
jgi:hypothetical protein